MLGKDGKNPGVLPSEERRIKFPREVVEGLAGAVIFILHSCGAISLSSWFNVFSHLPP
jgi:hypothetical protein